MRAARQALGMMALFIFAMLAMPAGMPAQETGDTDQSYRFSKEELTQMLAPIALYPDALTAQILMASTYPLEVVEADRWRDQNSQLTGSELDTALQDKPWDPSVKSLCHFPAILSSMSDKLDQTRKLGDAFLEQEGDVMATIQELRRKAQDLGHLTTTAEQRVIVEPDDIRIEPANPEVVYVPVYDPTTIYGPWWYPAYPPYYWYEPPIFFSGAFIGFGPRIFLGFDLFSWVRCDWRVHRIHIDIDRTRRFHHFSARRDVVNPVWRHNPVHRRGVAYRDIRTSERFGARAPRVAPSNLERRGYPQQRPTQVAPRMERQPAQSVPQARPVPQLRQEQAVTRPPESRRIETPQVRTEPVKQQRPELRESSPFRGIGEGSFERRAGERGGSSNRTIQMQQPQSVAPRPVQQFQRQESGGSHGGQFQQRQNSGGASRGGGQMQFQGGGGQGGGGGQRGGGSRR